MPIGDILLEKNRIKCGSCKSEYSPRTVVENLGLTNQKEKMDYSCPVCNHGKFGESFITQGKQILHD